MKLTRRAMGASTIALMAGCATGTAPAPTAPTTAAPHPSPAIGSFGVDLAARDLNVKPGDDFFRYVNGTWLANTQIPADRSRWGTFDILLDKSDRDQRAIIEEISHSGGAPGSNEQKIGDFYNAFVNQDAIDAHGLAPLQEDIAAIAALTTHEAIVRYAATPATASTFPVVAYVGVNQHDPNRYLVNVTIGGLGLPDRDYYTRTDGAFPGIRTQYAAHVERMLTLAGQSNPAAKARRIVALENQIAQLHWTSTERRERSRTDNVKTRAELSAIAPRYPFDAALQAANMDSATEVNVRELSAVGPLANLVLRTPVSTWREYLTWTSINGNAAVLPRTIDDATFDFYGKVLNGQPTQRERWKRSTDAVNAALGEAVGQIYVQRHFPPDAKAQALELVENMRRAYGERIAGLAWMSAETKVAAREKLALFRPKIGYPDRWRDYSRLELRAGDAYGNVRRATVFALNRQTNRLNQPTDRDEWSITPQTVNAYYNSNFNEIVFPAAILQPPFFDPNADPAVNYGAIGGVIGHEMGHGFDDQGAKSDGHGVLHDWWSATDVAAFRVITDKLVAQYDGFEPLPGLHVNGRLTLGENIGDNGGLQVAHRAYEMHLAGAAAPEIDGCSGEQRFFMGWAQAWRSAIRDEAQRNRLLTDVHSPGIYRCNGPVRNMTTWYAAFNVQPGDALYLAPADRVEIW